MKNKVLKLLAILSIIIIEFSVQIQADNIDTNAYKPVVNPNSNTKLIGIAGKILGTIQIVGSVMSVLVLVVIGIKYMTSSIEGKAKYKETIMPYIIGCILVFSVSNIASIIYSIATNMF